MPWKQVDAMTGRRQFVLDARQRLVTFTSVAQRPGECEPRARGGVRGLRGDRRGGMGPVLKLARFHEPLRRIEDAQGRLARKRV